jgi:hypothetical protein
MKFVKRHDVRRTKDYWFELDEYRDGEQTMLLAHLQFFHWSPSVCKAFRKDWRLFRQHVKCPLFACPKDWDTKMFKFVSMTGWRFLQHIECEDGETRPLFIHTT